jgi:hypothetical protein
MEETMRALTIEELMHLTRIELTGLLDRVESALLDFPEGSVERENALTSLRGLRSARRRCTSSFNPFILVHKPPQALGRQLPNKSGSKAIEAKAT